MSLRALFTASICKHSALREPNRNFKTNLLAKEVGGVADTTNNAQATSVGYRSGKLRTSSNCTEMSSKCTRGKRRGEIMR